VVAAEICGPDGMLRLRPADNRHFGEVHRPAERPESLDHVPACGTVRAVHVRLDATASGSAFRSRSAQQLLILGAVLKSL
jgi:hypothetical protein